MLTGYFNDWGGEKVMENHCISHLDPGRDWVVLYVGTMVRLYLSASFADPNRGKDLSEGYSWNHGISNDRGAK